MGSLSQTTVGLVGFSLLLLDKATTILFADSPVVELRTRARQENLLMTERWLSVEEIAAHLGVNRDTIYKWIERKKMPAHKVGRLWKFLASEVDLWVKQGSAARQPKEPHE